LKLHPAFGSGLSQAIGIALAANLDDKDHRVIASPLTANTKRGNMGGRAFCGKEQIGQSYGFYRPQQYPD